METIRTTVLCACCTALGLTLAEGILPMKRFQRQIKLMLTILMMTAILKPLSHLDFSAFSNETLPENPALSDITARADAARDQAVSDSILHALNNALEEHHVPCTVTEVRLHIQDDGSIIINEVIIHGNAITGTVYLREWLGNEPIITEEEESLDSSH